MGNTESLSIIKLIYHRYFSGRGTLYEQSTVNSDKECTMCKMNMRIVLTIKTGRSSGWVFCCLDMGLLEDLGAESGAEGGQDLIGVEGAWIQSSSAYACRG